MNANEKNNSEIVIGTRSAFGGGMAAALILVTLLFAWFSIRWQLGNMIGSLTPANDPRAAEAADAAVSLAPGDPMANWLAASKAKDDLTTQGQARSVDAFRQVVSLSPYDFRWWIELGRACEQAEVQTCAESALKRAVELAPSYTYPHWQLGNYYLRQGRTDDAIAELKKATEQSIDYREQVFSLAWDYFDKDPKMVEALAADRPDVKATLASFFARRGQAEAALRVWNSLSDEQKAPHAQIARDIAQGLFDRKYYREALAFAKQTGMDPDARFETISNGGFETLVAGADAALFQWRINRSEGRADAMPDSTVKTEGNRSLKIAFKGYTRPDLYTLAQIVAVQPGARYRLSFKLRTDNLKSAGPPLIKVTSGLENTIVAATAPFATGSADWKEISLEFTVPDTADGIEIFTSRALCAEECPITGTIWYDDFQLSRL